MVLTAHGFWSPDTNTPMSLQGMFSAAATASEVANRVTALRDGVPRASSAAALSALYAGQNDPISGLPLAPVLGSQGSINGTPVVWLDTTQRTSAGWYPVSDTPMLERVQDGTSVSIPTNAWTLVNRFYSAGDTNNSVGYYTATATGIIVSQAGQYAVEGGLAWSTNGTGFRYLGIGTAAAGPPRRQVVPAIPSDGANFFRCELGLTAGQTVSLVVYQSSGVTLTVSGSRIRVRLIA